MALINVITLIVPKVNISNKWVKLTDQGNHPEGYNCMKILVGNYYLSP